MRAGASACLELPLTPEHIVERILTLIGEPGARADRVLVVDDQPVAALFAARVLEGVGILTERVIDPLGVLDALARFEPDLVLMDLHMPGASGIELTRIIRDQDRFADLPIVFLSAELDTEQQLAALRVGGDDFLAKPVPPDRLVACVTQRLARVRERARRQHGRALIDALTGLPSRERLLERLGRLIGQDGADPAQRALFAFALAGTSPDLPRLAVLLAERILRPDWVARLGEHSLGVLLRRPDAEACAAAGAALAEALHRAMPETEIGIGWCPLCASGGDAFTLASRAGKAALAALAAGAKDPIGYPQQTSTPAATDAVEPVRAALRAEQLQLLFEPMVTLMQASRARYEVSPRLVVSDGELLPPALFTPVARASGLQESIDHWVLTQGLEVLMSHHRAGTPVQLFIHQSLASLTRATWLEQVRDEINRRELFRLRPVLQFQIDEVAHAPDLLHERVTCLARLGIRVCLNGLDASDEAGEVLTRAPVTFVRLQRETVHSLPAEALAALIRGVKSSGFIVIATGIEAPETIARLCRAGADLLQGPFVQPPSPEMDYDFSGPDATGT
nr:EAL domain-containing protein [Thiocapsa imhoffii]